MNHIKFYKELDHISKQYVLIIDFIDGTLS